MSSSAGTFFLKGAVSVCHGWSAVFNDSNSFFKFFFLFLIFFFPVTQQLPSLAFLGLKPENGWLLSPSLVPRMSQIRACDHGLQHLRVVSAKDADHSVVWSTKHLVELFPLGFCLQGKKDVGWLLASPLPRWILWVWATELLEWRKIMIRVVSFLTKE